MFIYPFKNPTTRSDWTPYLSLLQAAVQSIGADSQPWLPQEYSLKEEQKRLKKRRLEDSFSFRVPASFSGVSGSVALQVDGEEV